MTKKCSSCGAVVEKTDQWKVVAGRDSDGCNLPPVLDLQQSWNSGICPCCQKATLRGGG